MYHALLLFIVMENINANAYMFVSNILIRENKMNMHR